MKLPPLPLLLGAALFAGVLQAQVVPTTPTQFGKRGVGGFSESGGSASIGIAPGAGQQKPVVKEINYIALTADRQWTNPDNKTIVAKLIAFEQMEQVLPAGRAAPDPAAAQPKLPARPTVIRQGNVRMLMNQKAVEVPLDKLSQADRDFIQQLDAAIAKKAAATETKPETTAAPAKAP